MVTRRRHHTVKARDIGTDGGSDPDSEEEHIQGTLLIAGSSELRDAILAKIVDKYADPGYWEKWATNIRDIAVRHEARIRALLNDPDAGVRRSSTASSPASGTT